MSEILKLLMKKMKQIEEKDPKDITTEDIIEVKDMVKAWIEFIKTREKKVGIKELLDDIKE